jgi:hypothetical protein
MAASWLAPVVQQAWSIKDSIASAIAAAIQALHLYREATALTGFFETDAASTGEPFLPLLVAVPLVAW